MAKLETPAALPAALRPPRPAVRMRAGAAAPDESEAPHDARAELHGDAYVSGHPADGHYSEGHYPEHGYLDGAGPDVVEVLELDDDEVLADDAETPLSDEAVTERGFDASTFGLPRAGGTKLPMASLEMPSASRLDLTPSPVPRVALTPATGAVDISLVPGPHASRNLPTLAAFHVLGRKPARRPASAITFPPPRRGSADAPRLGAGLAKDVRSSKREIVLGLAIGLGLSLVLAAAGQAYLREEPVASSSAPEVESLALSPTPEAVAPATSAVDDSLATAPAGGDQAVAEPIARAAVSERAASSPLVNARQRRAGLVSGLDDSSSQPTAYTSQGGAVARRAHARHDGAPRALGPARTSSSSAQASGKTYESRVYDDPPPAPVPPASLAPASLSPAESAGLGLDLPL